MDDDRPLLILDTMVLTWLLDPRSPRADWEAFVVGRTLGLTFVTVGEILHLGLKWSAQRRADLEKLIAAYPTIPGTIGVARKFADIRLLLHDQIPANDMWMAACLLTQTRPVELATEDGHFGRVSDHFPLITARA